MFLQSIGEFSTTAAVVMMSIHPSNSSTVLVLASSGGKQTKKYHQSSCHILLVNGGMSLARAHTWLFWEDKTKRHGLFGRCFFCLVKISQYHTVVLRTSSQLDAVTLL